MESLSDHEIFKSADTRQPILASFCAPPLSFAVQEREEPRRKLLRANIISDVDVVIMEGGGVRFACSNEEEPDGVSNEEAREGWWVFVALDEDLVPSLRSSIIAAGMR